MATRNPSEVDRARVSPDGTDVEALGLNDTSDSGSDDRLTAEDSDADEDEAQAGRRT